MVRYFQQLGAVHRDFLQRSADVHQRFLALQRSTEATLFRAYGAVLRGTASGRDRRAARDRRARRSPPRLATRR